MNSSDFKYRGDVDGLRAIAILSVVLFHADLGFRGGFVGVDVFFVISGYLITSISLRDAERGQLRLANFLERRVRRILPAQFIMIIVTAIVGYLVLLPSDLIDLGRSMAAQAALCANIYFWTTTGYFQGPAEDKPLLHLWSLALEEQFYLLFPILLLWMIRNGRKRLLIVQSVVATVSLLASLYGTARHPSATFYLLPTRAWELLLGSIVATLPQVSPKSRASRELLSVAGIASITASAWFYTESTPFPGAAALVPSMGTVSVLFANSASPTFSGQFLATRSFTYLGVISYSLYLWHWPLLVFVRYCAIRPLDSKERLLIVFASLAAAVLSWRVIEEPFRRRRVVAPHRHMIRLAAIAIAIQGAIGFGLIALEGAPRRVSEATKGFANARFDVGFVREASPEMDGRWIFPHHGAPSGKVFCLIWGDSHAMAIMPAIDGLCREHRMQCIAATHSNTMPALNYVSNKRYALGPLSVPFAEAVLQTVKVERVPHVLIAANWVSYIDATDAAELGRLEWRMRETVSALRKEGATVWFLAQTPQHDLNVPRTLSRASQFGWPLDALGVPLSVHYDRTNGALQLLRRVAGARATILDPAPLLADSDGMCRMNVNEHSLYRDSGHLSTFGAMHLRYLFDPIFYDAESLE